MSARRDLKSDVNAIFLVELIGEIRLVSRQPCMIILDLKFKKCLFAPEAELAISFSEKDFNSLSQYSNHTFTSNIRFCIYRFQDGLLPETCLVR